MVLYSCKKFLTSVRELVLVIGMSGVQLQINHESLPAERKILSECEARGQNLVLPVMTSD